WYRDLPMREREHDPSAPVEGPRKPLLDAIGTSPDADDVVVPPIAFEYEDAPRGCLRREEVGRKGPLLGRRPDEHGGQAIVDPVDDRLCQLFTRHHATSVCWFAVRGDCHGCLLHNLVAYAKNRTLGLCI